MSESPLPKIRCHPDPIATGCIEASDTPCVCCGQARGYVYVGPVYAVEEYDREICPWCIADGSAHTRLAVSFVGTAWVTAGLGAPSPTTSRRRLRTGLPGSGWQQERWFTCCGDAACYQGRSGFEELMARGPGAVEATRLEIGWEDGPHRPDSLRSLAKDEPPTAYLFCCTRCGALGGYNDFT